MARHHLQFRIQTPGGARLSRVGGCANWRASTVCHEPAPALGAEVRAGELTDEVVDAVRIAEYEGKIAELERKVAQLTMKSICSKRVQLGRRSVVTSVSGPKHFRHGGCAR